MIANLADELCNPVGGFAGSANTTINATGTSGPAASVPAFEGGVGKVSAEWAVYVVSGLFLWGIVGR